MRKSWVQHRLSGRRLSLSATLTYSGSVSGCCEEHRGSWLSDPVMWLLKHGESSLDLPVFESYLTTHPSLQTPKNISLYQVAALTISAFLRPQAPQGLEGAPLSSCLS